MRNEALLTFLLDVLEPGLGGAWADITVAETSNNLPHDGDWQQRRDRLIGLNGPAGGDQSRMGREAAPHQH
jgi:hypothetical protein